MEVFTCIHFSWTIHIYKMPAIRISLATFLAFEFDSSTWAVFCLFLSLLSQFASSAALLTLLQAMITQLLLHPFIFFHSSVFTHMFVILLRYLLPFLFDHLAFLRLPHFMCLSKNGNTKNISAINFSFCFSATWCFFFFFFFSISEYFFVKNFHILFLCYGCIVAFLFGPKWQNVFILKLSSSHYALATAALCMMMTFFAALVGLVCMGCLLCHHSFASKEIRIMTTSSSVSKRNRVCPL